MHWPDGGWIGGNMLWLRQFAQVVVGVRRLGYFDRLGFGLGCGGRIVDRIVVVAVGVVAVADVVVVGDVVVVDDDTELG